MKSNVTFDNYTIAIQLIEILMERGEINQETYTRIMRNAKKSNNTLKSKEY